MIDRLTALYEALTPLWEMSLTAAYAAVVVAALRFLLRKHAPKRVLCLLWLVVFARLLVPLSLESPLSIVPDAGQGGFVQLVPTNPAGTAPSGDGQDSTAGSVPADTHQSSQTGPALTVPDGVKPAAPAAPEQGRAFPWKALAAGVWLAGVLAMGGYGLISYLRLRRRLYDAIRARDGAWEHPAVGSPFILGLIRPKIYLPPGLTGQARRFILCHERAHLRRLDHIVKPVCWLALAIHWFNPAAWFAFVLMSRDMEGACDEAVIRRLGGRVKADYSETLLALATGGRVPAPCPLAFDEGDAKGRVKHVLRYRRPALWIIVVSVIAAVAAAVCLLTDPMAQKPDDPQPSIPAPGPSQSPGALPSPTPAPDEELNAVLDPWMLEVLKGERTFYANDAQRDVNHLTQAFYGDEPPEGAAVSLLKLAILDLDRDGANELVLLPNSEHDDDIVYSAGYLVLRRNGDEVYGHALGYRGFGNLKADGTFNWSSSAANSGTGRLRFDGARCETDPITWCDYGDSGVGAFFVEGQSATQAEFDSAIAAQGAKPEPFWYTFENGAINAPISIPLNIGVQGAPVPDFLDGEQQLLYRHAYFLYSQLFGPATSAVDEWPGPVEQPSAQPVEVDGYTYTPATGLFAKWDDLETAALSVFTPEFFEARNTWLDNDGNPHWTFINVDGRTYYIDGARGSSGYNWNFPETFQLTERTDTKLSFTMTGHYSETFLLEGESMEERDARLKANWETYIDFPMELVRTENGWRFAEFHVAYTDNAQLPYANQAQPNPD